VIEHKLAVDPAARPIKQKVQRQAQDRQNFIIHEVLKLEAAGVVIRTLHPTWTATRSCMVPKPNLKKRMCVDFTDLNRACPMELFPLPGPDHGFHRRL
jgi:hypothetical protein